MEGLLFPLTSLSSLLGNGAGAMLLPLQPVCVEAAPEAALIPLGAGSWDSEPLRMCSQHQEQQHSFRMSTSPTPVLAGSNVVHAGTSSTGASSTDKPCIHKDKHRLACHANTHTPGNQPGGPLATRYIVDGTGYAAPDPI